MGPQRKQARLDEACKTSPEVAEAYKTLKEATDNKNDPDRIRPHIGRDIHAAREALQGQLLLHGMNRFDARDLSNFVVISAAGLTH